MSATIDVKQVGRIRRRRPADRLDGESYRQARASAAAKNRSRRRAGVNAFAPMHPVCGHEYGLITPTITAYETCSLSVNEGLRPGTCS